MIERYLHKSTMLKAVFLLIDIRHDPSKNDKMMYDWILHQGYEPVIIATKLDKLKKSQVAKQLKSDPDRTWTGKRNYSDSFFRQDKAG